MISDEGWGTYPSNGSERGLAATRRRPDAWATQDFEDLDVPAALDHKAEPSGSLEAPLLGQRMRPSRHSIDDLGVTKPSGGSILAAPVAIPEPPPTDDLRTTTPLSDASTLAAAPVEVVEPPPQSVIDDDDAYFHPVGGINAVAAAEGHEATSTIRLARTRTRRSWLVAGLVAIVTPLVLLACIMGVGQVASGRAEPRVARTVDSTKHSFAVSMNALKRRPAPATRAKVTVRGPKSTRPAPARKILRVRK